MSTILIVAQFKVVKCADLLEASVAVLGHELTKIGRRPESSCMHVSRNLRYRPVLRLKEASFSLSFLIECFFIFLCFASCSLVSVRFSRCFLKTF